MSSQPDYFSDLLPLLDQPQIDAKLNPIRPPSAHKSGTDKNQDVVPKIPNNDPINGIGTAQPATLPTGTDSLDSNSDFTSILQDIEAAKQAIEAGRDYTPNDAAATAFSTGQFQQDQLIAIFEAKAKAMATIATARSTHPAKSMDVYNNIERKVTLAYFETTTVLHIKQRTGFVQGNLILHDEESSLANDEIRCTAGGLTQSFLASLKPDDHPYLVHLIEENRLEFAGFVQPTAATELQELNIWSDENTALLFKSKEDEYAIFTFLANELYANLSVKPTNTAMFTCSFAVDTSAAPLVAPASTLKSRLQKHLDKIVSHITTGGNNELVAPHWKDGINKQGVPCKIFVLGDLEGHLFMLCEWLQDMNLLNKDLSWNASAADNANVFVVQCGDQLDNGAGPLNDPRQTRSNFEHVDSDLAVPLFMDYLNVASGGRVISILGNHEWFNMQNYFEYCSNESCKKMQLADREKLFAPNGIMAFIMKRRNFMARINQFVFSHGGLTPATLDAYRSTAKPGIQTDSKLDINEVIKSVNLEVRNVPNVTQGKETDLFKNVIAAQFDDTTKLLWERFEGKFKQQNKPLPVIYDKLSGEDEIVQITGHNTVQTMQCCTRSGCEPCADKSYRDEDHEIQHIFTDVETRRIAPLASDVTLAGMRIDLDDESTATFAVQKFTSHDIVSKMEEIKNNSVDPLNLEVAAMLVAAQVKVAENEAKDAALLGGDVTKKKAMPRRRKAGV